MFTARLLWNCIVLLLLSNLLVVSQGIAAPREKTQLLLQTNYDSVMEAVSSLIRSEMKKSDITGLSIALVDDQRVVWAQGFGYADESKDVAATPETVYRIGTLTKLFTATALMQLAEQKKINLDKPLKTALPEFSIRSRFRGTASITPRNLLTHHSGLPTDFQKGTWSRRPEPFTTVLGLLKDDSAAYPPGLLFVYSNIGYDLLGLVIERASKQDYAFYIQSRLLQPLGMRYSGFTPPAIPRLMSKAYLKGTETDDPPLRDIPSAGMYSTVLDLGQFMHMLFADGRANNRTLLKPKTLAEMFRQQNKNVPLDLGLQVGLGWMLGGLGELNIRNAGLVAHHAGSTLLHRSQMIVVPEHKLGVVVLANSSTAGRTAATVAAKALELALEVKVGIRQPLPEKSPEVARPLSPEVRQNYAGQYASMMGFAEILPGPDHIRVEVLNRTFRLVPHANGKFGIQYVLLGLIPFSLWQLEGNEISHARIAGREILKASTPGGDILIAEKIIAAAVPDVWQKRVGKYGIENVGNDILVFEDISLRFDKGVLLLECSLPYFLKTPLRFPLTVLSDTEAVITGLGRGLGGTIRVMQKNGKEGLYFSGYLLSREL